MGKTTINIIGKQFSSIDINKAIDIVERDIVYIGGSLIEGEYNKLSSGMGNHKSDLDLFIIKDRNSYETIEYVYNFNIRKVDFKVINGIDFDIEYFNHETINKVIECLDNINYDINERVDNMISLPSGWRLDDINEFLTRIYYAKCIYNEEAFNNLKKRLKFDSFNKIYRDQTINIMENMIADAIGNLEVGQNGTALYSSRSAFLYFLRFIVLSENEFIDRDKWIILKFFNIVQQKNKYRDVADKYNELFLKDLSNKVVLEKTIKNLINFIRCIVEDMMIGDII